MAVSETDSRPVVLHIGDPIKYNLEQYANFERKFRVIRPSTADRQRAAFMKALQDERWGTFDAIFRPFWDTGGEMGRWDRELVPLLPSSVRVFASAGAGYDWADVDVLAEKGIIYCNGASASSESVGDLTLFLIIAGFRNLAWCTEAARSGDAAQFLDCHEHSVKTARNPRGHVLGIIGMGNIGRVIAAKVFAALGMEIAYHDFNRKPAVDAECRATYYPVLEDMLPHCDCVVVATPAFADGRKMITAERLARFKRGARLVNIARGSLVDEDAVADAMESGRLSAVGLDVHDSEPVVHPRLRSNRNVTVTCHNAGGTMDTHCNFEALAMCNIEAVLTGQVPLSPVNMHLMRRT